MPQRKSLLDRQWDAHKEPIVQVGSSALGVVNADGTSVTKSTNELLEELLIEMRKVRLGLEMALGESLIDPG